MTYSLKIPFIRMKPLLLYPPSEYCPIADTPTYIPDDVTGQLTRCTQQVAKQNVLHHPVTKVTSG